MQAKQTHSLLCFHLLAGIYVVQSLYTCSKNKRHQYVNTLSLFLDALFAVPYIVGYKYQI